MSRWIDFNGTISGGEYFVRGLVSGIFYIAALGIASVLSDGTGGAGDIVSLIALIAGVMTSLAFGLSTTNKRLNALMPNNKVLGWVLTLVPFFGWYLLFANSDIEKHNG